MKSKERKFAHLYIPDPLIPSLSPYPLFMLQNQNKCEIIFSMSFYPGFSENNISSHAKVKNVKIIYALRYFSFAFPRDMGTTCTLLS